MCSYHTAATSRYLTHHQRPWISHWSKKQVQKVTDETNRNRTENVHKAQPKVNQNVTKNRCENHQKLAQKKHQMVEKTIHNLRKTDSKIGNKMFAQQDAKVVSPNVATAVFRSPRFRGSRIAIWTKMHTPLPAVRPQAILNLSHDDAGAPVPSPKFSPKFLCFSSAMRKAMPP